MVAIIGNGLYARTRPRRPSLMDQYRKLQASCGHEKRDPRGMCYRCGEKLHAPPIREQIAEEEA